MNKKLSHLKTRLNVDLVKVVAKLWLVLWRRFVVVFVAKHVVFSDGLGFAVLKVAVGESHRGLELRLLDTGEAVAVGLVHGVPQRQHRLLAFD